LSILKKEAAVFGGRVVSSNKVGTLRITTVPLKQRSVRFGGEGACSTKRTIEGLEGGKPSRACAWSSQAGNGTAVGGWGGPQSVGISWKKKSEVGNRPSDVKDKRTGEGKVGRLG